MCSLKLNEEQDTYSLVSHLACQIISNSFPKVIGKTTHPILHLPALLSSGLTAPSGTPSGGGGEMAVIVP